MSIPILYIFGASGSGTTTLGRAASEALGWQHFDIDDYYWLPTDPPFHTARPHQERLPLLLEHMRGASGAVLTGWGKGWVYPLIPDFRLAVRLTLEPALRLKRLEARERANFGGRLDPGGDMYENHREFMAWAAQFDTGGLGVRSKASLDAWQERLSCPVLTLDSAERVETNLALVLAALKVKEKD